MIRTSLIIILLTIATSRITFSADPSFADRYFGAMESRPAVAAPAKKEPGVSVKPPIKKIGKRPTPRELHLADQARHRAQRVAPPKLTFDGVYYWNEQGEAVAMKTRCKACRIGQ